MKAKLLPLFLLAALPAAALAATPPNTLVVVQSLDDIVSLDPAEANELSSIQTVPSLYQRLVQADRDDPAGRRRCWRKAGRAMRRPKR